MGVRFEPTYPDDAPANFLAFICMHEILPQSLRSRAIQS